VALTEAQILKCARILGVTYIDVNDKITNLGTNYITAQVQTDIAAELLRWDTAGIDFVSIEPQEKNFGARIDPEKQKNDIRKNLATLLYFTELRFSSTWGHASRA
jgi:hypothetical protein